MSIKTRHVAQAGVSLECIREALHLPDDSEIINLKYDGYSGCVVSQSRAP